MAHPVDVAFRVLVWLADNKSEWRLDQFSAVSGSVWRRAAKQLGPESSSIPVSWISDRLATTRCCICERCRQSSKWASQRIISRSLSKKAHQPNGFLTRFMLNLRANSKRAFAFSDWAESFEGAVKVAANNQNWTPDWPVDEWEQSDGEWSLPTRWADSTSYSARSVKQASERS